MEERRRGIGREEGDKKGGGGGGGRRWQSLSGPDKGLRNVASRSQSRHVSSCLSVSPEGPAEEQKGRRGLH